MFKSSITAVEIKRLVESQGYYIFKNVLDSSVFDVCLNNLEYQFKSNQLLGTTQGDRNSVRNNSIKWSVGAFQGSQIGNSRLMVSFYNPLFKDDIYSFHNNFIKIINIRDFIRNDNQSTFDINLSNDAFNACRFQYYPSGGGFMSMHKDTTGAEATSSLQYLQLLAPITKRGVQFNEGGAILRKNDLDLDLESLISPGDVLVYDANSLHGVKDIDPQLALNTYLFKGRVVALTTIYN